jgi:GGDEF domain-containing protein
MALMSYELCPLHVVVISQQVSLLHDISWILEAVGYKVQTTNDFGQDALWRRYSTADFVIVDGRGIAEPTAATFAIDSDKPLYRIFLYDPTKPIDSSAWYAAGAHDALRTPISRGEFLARVRTGARYLEFERRLQNRSSRCAMPGMYSRRGFLRKLRKLAAGDELGSLQQVLLMTSIDWYVGIRGKCGETASHSLVNTAARAIKRIAGENAISAYLGEGRFATLLVGQSPAAAKNVAESLARDFGSRESHHESIPRPALTSAVVPWSTGSNADRLLNDAMETLELAEHSGGGCVILEGEFSREFSAWKADMSSGNPFVNVVAQDIMEPFPAVLQLDAEQSELADVLRSSGIPVRPYVDRDGRLIGIAVDERAGGEALIDRASGLTGETLVMPETISFDASFPEIYEAFSSRGCATLVVTANDRPLGYLTCDGFLSMIDPIDAESFAQTEVSADELNYLVVPSSFGEAAAAETPVASVAVEN